jgi:hypothetical protein
MLTLEAILQTVMAIQPRSAEADLPIIETEQQLEQRRAVFTTQLRECKRHIRTVDAVPDSPRRYLLGNLSWLDRRDELRVRHRDDLLKALLAAEQDGKKELVKQLNAAIKTILLHPSREEEVYARIGNPWDCGVVPPRLSPPSSVSSTSHDDHSTDSNNDNDLSSVFDGSEASDRTTTPANSHLTRVSEWVNDAEMAEHDSNDAASNASDASVDSFLAQIPEDSMLRWPAWAVDIRFRMLERELRVARARERRRLSRRWYSFIFDFMAWFRDNWTTIVIVCSIAAFLFFVLCGQGMYECGCVLHVHDIIRGGTPTRK